MRSRASSFKLQYPLLSPRSSSNCLRLLPRLLVTSIRPFIFPSITSFRRQFLRKMFIHTSSNYRTSNLFFYCCLTVNTLHLHYKNHLINVVYGDNRHLFWEADRHINRQIVWVNCKVLSVQAVSVLLTVNIVASKLTIKISDTEVNIWIHIQWIFRISSQGCPKVSMALWYRLRRCKRILLPKNI
jgi:hypothetical protein